MIFEHRQKIPKDDFSSISFSKLNGGNLPPTKFFFLDVDQTLILNFRISRNSHFPP